MGPTAGQGLHRIKTYEDRYGYLCCGFYHAGGRHRTRTVHDVVAEAFHGPRPVGLTVAHLDGQQLNNTPRNLAYATYKEQSFHRDLHGRTSRGDKHYKSKLTDEGWLELFGRAAAGEPIKVLAKEYGVGLSTVYLTRDGRSRQHLQPQIAAMFPRS
jgi:hypothetical protein